MSTGLPTASSFDDYGGSLVDYLIAATDPTTDRTAAQVNQALSDVAAMTRLADRAAVSMTLAGSSAPTLTKHDAQWGNAIGVAPVLARTGTGTITITWPATVTIDGGVATSVNLQFIKSRFASAAGVGVVAAITAPNVVTVTTFDPSTNIATDFTGQIVTVIAC